MSVKTGEPFRTSDYVQGFFVAPSAGWNGTAGTGFGGSYGAVPSDPTRTTAKPACRLLTPPNQFFTDAMLVGVLAMANDSGSLLDNLGLEYVRVHFEGSTVDITRPTFQTFDDANGNPVTYFGWWCWLKKPAGVAGKANVYFEAVPKDGTMQHRVMGPYEFFPQTYVYDYEVEVAATPAEVTGSRYKTLVAAQAYLRTVSAKNPRITITEAGTYDFANGAPSYGSDGYLNIEATAPVTIARADGIAESAMLMRTYWNVLHFKGSNITIDRTNITSIATENFNTRLHWYDGINCVEPRGQYFLKRKGPFVGFGIGGGWYTEVTVESWPDAFNGAHLVRGCTATGGTRDVATAAFCIVDNVVDDWDADLYREYVAALTVQYTGAGSTATLAFPGTNDTSSGSGRTFTAKVDGATVGTFTVYNNEGQFLANTNYTVQNVVDWLNSLTGWTATLLDDTRRATAITGLTGDHNVKTAAVTLYTWFDQHCDFWQSSGATENVIFWGNRCTAMNTQNIYWNTNAFKDCFAVNNAFDQKVENYPLFSQIGAAHSHTCIVHNSMASQAFSLLTNFSDYRKYVPDAYCLVANNAAPGLTGNPAAANAATVIVGNVIDASNSVHLALGGTNNSAAGDADSKFVDRDAGDFTPQGELLSNLKTSLVRFDANRVERAATDAAGALAA